jgi:hypothetical protein
VTLCVCVCVCFGLTHSLWNVAFEKTEKLQQHVIDYDGLGTSRCLSTERHLGGTCCLPGRVSSVDCAFFVGCLWLVSVLRPLAGVMEHTHILTYSSLACGVCAPSGLRDRLYPKSTDTCVRSAFS